ncbi:hypothetical protein BJY16_007253 [Actinoplanes octamycinicus]|uniref:Uncharacterized protein n=1 Tax=Actinoplanes octamycinicus TaxID=135948 RepID=A0A7W7MB55_9ACTN|nr:hypothetical protein [Actinoplanes octamycinicus]MBB4743794.1 hypothetical protein [Actinoplanes octamycinicus]
MRAVLAGRVRLGPGLASVAGGGQEFVEDRLADHTDQAVTGLDDDPDSGGASSAADQCGPRTRPPNAMSDSRQPFLMSANSVVP